MKFIGNLEKRSFLQRIKLAYRAFTKGGIPLPETNCSVVEVDPDDLNMRSALGITDERAEELLEALNKSYIKNDSLNTVMVELSHTCKHPNELAMYCFILGNFIGEKRSHPLHSLLKHLRKDK